MTTYPENFRSLLLDTELTLASIEGPWNIPVCDESIRKRADHAIAGILCSAGDPAFHVQTASEAIDWSGGKEEHGAVLRMALLRFHFLVPLTSAWMAHKKEAYAETARMWIERFMDDHPLQDGAFVPAPYDTATQYELRMGCTEIRGWLGCLPFFLDSQAFANDGVVTRILDYARAELQYLSQHVYPHWNIRLTHGNVLLLNSLRLSFLPEAESWRAQGVRIINEEVGRQIMPDGSHSEATPQYHNVVLQVVKHMWMLSRRMPALGIRIDTDRVAAMHDYAVCSRRPDGEITPIHDTTHKKIAEGDMTRSIDERARFRRAAGLPEKPLPLCMHFPNAGQTFLRDSWEKDATYITFDATPRRSFHWHPSRNAIQLQAYGQELITDHGYPLSCPGFPAYSSNTAEHSTLNLNGWDQSQSMPHSRMRCIPDPCSPACALVEGWYDGGYWPIENCSHGAGIFAEHYRALLWIPEHCVIVFDHLYHTASEERKPTLESVWQLAPSVVNVDERAGRAVMQGSDANLHMLFPLRPDGMKMQVHEGEQAPWHGWLPLNKKYTPAPQVRLVSQQHDPWNTDLVTVLMPFTGNVPPAMEAHVVVPDGEPNDKSVWQLDLAWETGKRLRVWWTRRFANAVHAPGMDSEDGLIVETCAADHATWKSFASFR